MWFVKTIELVYSVSPFGLYGIRKGYGAFDRVIHVWRKEV